jgi:ABC-type amino acid transport substrate-binding protein
MVRRQLPHTAHRHASLRRRVRRLVCSIGCTLLVAAPLRAEPLLRVIYPRAESALDARVSYPLAVLRMALQHSGREFALQASAIPMQQARSLRLVADGRLDVVWSVTTVEREAALRPIRIPIDFGLFGWRVLLIRRGDVARFAAIDSLAGLAGLVAGQGHDWPDLSLLRHNGLQVTPVTTYEGLFAMLARGRIDYFPRALTEVREELARHAAEPIELESTLLLHYPSALYFFVGRDNGELASAIESGLEGCITDGSLKSRFEQEYAADIAATAPAGRRVLALDNPDLPPATPLARAPLWIDPTVALR